MHPTTKLLGITPCIKEYPQHHAVCRRDQVVQTWLTHAFLLKGEPPSKYIGYQCSLALRHILLECVDFTALHRQYLNVNSK